MLLCCPACSAEQLNVTYPQGDINFTAEGLADPKISTTYMARLEQVLKGVKLTQVKNLRKPRPCLPINTSLLSKMRG